MTGQNNGTPVPCADCRLIAGIAATTGQTVRVVRPATTEITYGRRNKARLMVCDEHALVRAGLGEKS